MTLEPIEEVQRAILARLRPLPGETIPLESAVGRTLAEDIHALDPIPPFDNTSMDGFGVRCADLVGATESAPRTLEVIGRVEAGAETLPRLGAGQALRIFTGAPIPPDVDAVIPWERALGSDDRSVTFGFAPAAGLSIRRLGSDVDRGARVLSAGCRLTPAAVGLLATVGRAKVRVGRRPRVAVHSSGNELLSVTEALRPGKIRNSNLYSIAARLRTWGAEVDARPVLVDTPEGVRHGLLETLARSPDAIITTGGISAGDLDHIRDVARELGDDVRVRRVDMKPGKPLVDGLLGDVPFFGLPGNPAACLVSFEIFVRPALAHLEGREDGSPPRRWARVKETVTLAPTHRPQFCRGRVEYSVDNREYELVVDAAQGSHQMASFATANCLVPIEPDQGALAAGDLCEVLLLEEVR